MNVENKFNLELVKYQTQVNARLNKMQEQHFVQRLWNKDASLWTENNNIENEISAVSLGWLNAAGKMLKELPMVEKFCRDIRFSGFEAAVLLGMGGSSMAPLIFQKHFKSTTGIKLIVLDSTDPKMIKKVENEITISKTLFIVSSKSGNTAEVMAFYNYFFHRVYQFKKQRTGENFIAITDEGSPLAVLAMKKKFRKLFINFSDIGGRFSVLSYFGIIPAVLMGIDIKTFLERTLQMVVSCSIQQPVSQNPGVVLGAAIAELALQGCNKLTYLMPPELATFGLWLEQLLAESTGKQGTGILPLNGYPINELSAYGNDRLFFSLDFSEKQNKIQSEKMKSFSSMNYPVITSLIKDELDLGQEFFRWEIAAATAGYLLGVNPFDQPDVQESKKCTDQLLQKLEQDGKLPEMEPALTEDHLHYYIAPKANDKYNNWTEGKLLLENFFAITKPGNYIALLAYLPEESKVLNSFSEIQYALQKTLHLPVTTQFGPRYLHSTGQYHKGGPNTGFFIHFICNSSEGIQIPGHAYTFGLLKRAQAIGDMEALVDHDRNVILIDLGKNYIKGLNSFLKIVQQLEPVKKSNRKSINYRNELEVAEVAYL